MTFKTPFWSPSQASAILFDWDGVIADTRLDFSGIREKYYGHRRAMLLEDAHTLGPAREAMMSELEDIEVRGAERATWIVCARETLEWVNRVRKPWAIVSRNCKKSILAAAEVLGMKLPAVVRSRDDGDCVKPDPRALIETCGLLSVSPAQTLLVGDYIYDVMGARRAGMRSALVRDKIEPGWTEWLECSFSSMREFLENLENPSEFIPWEYKETAEKFGNDFLRRAHRIFIPLPQSPRPSLDAWVARAASLGAGGFLVKDEIFSPDMWRRNPSLDIAGMGLGLAETIGEFLRERWPFASVARSADRTVPFPPQDADGLPEFLSS
ncbi:MAG: HAD-IA family hydrolase, partial [Synergistaceae bacterium]|nr:HAD-IA family hydrolase [Synergistaceae bacterium]